MEVDQGRKSICAKILYTFDFLNAKINLQNSVGRGIDDLEDNFYRIWDDSKFISLNICWRIYFIYKALQ